MLYQTPSIKEVRYLCCIAELPRTRTSMMEYSPQNLVVAEDCLLHNQPVLGPETIKMKILLK